MKWTDIGPTLSREDFLRFERESGRKVPFGIRWFLTHVSNGGDPVDELSIPVRGVRDDTMVLLSLLGINHSDPGKSMLDDVVNAEGWWMQLYWPMGRDPWGGGFYYVHRGPFRGQVRYVSFEENLKADKMKSHLVARNIKEFAKLVPGLTIRP